eukprot:g61882.t1
MQRSTHGNCSLFKGLQCNSNNTIQDSHYVAFEYLRFEEPVRCLMTKLRFARNGQQSVFAMQDSSGAELWLCALHCRTHKTYLMNLRLNNAKIVIDRGGLLSIIRCDFSNVTLELNYGQAVLTDSHFSDSVSPQMAVL